MTTLHQLELFTAPVDLYQARVDAALFRSLHHVENAKIRWAKYRKRGLTDAELKQAIAHEFGIYGGSTYPETHCFKGGEDPIFWLALTHHSKPTLRGQPLLKRVRMLLEIPRPLN